MTSGESGKPNAPANDESEPKAASGLARAWMYGAIAFEFTASVVGGGVLGYWVDRWWSTQPIWTVVLLLLGFAGGMTLFLRGLTRLESR